MTSRSLIAEVAVWGRLVKFSHSIFALPFAVSMGVIVWRDTSIPLSAWAAMLVAIVSARTAAMAFNRLLDHRIDAINPRTQGRELPQGVLKPSSVWVLLVMSIGIFIAASAALGRHCLELAPFVIALLLFYSCTKRFTRYSHFVLGAALACAPGGVWYALRGTVALEPLSLMAGVMFWVAGFDILYACQDEEFDRQQGLLSIPAVKGTAKAMRLSVWLHLLSLGAFLLFGISAHMGVWYVLGLALFALVLMGQHRLVSPSDLSRIDAAFFTRNGLASVLFLCAVVLDSVLR